MDWQSAFNLLFMAFMAACGWVLRSVHDAIQRLTTDVKVLEKELPATYARKDDLNLMLADIKGALIRIEEKLEGKANR
jgi:outer membrane lipopolysaccharide assembly protein LptE/RlpB